ncbi:hypothetical protein RR42_m0785 [Cupriavidus basilensis]|uniref:Uncharacterized protein n=1 Tax=Cupriavidus basilensis TaxID=68895 RepID=A0A0C4Y046_9BURK|nr:hypothetical protein RR42_m0785 [Cupriavidus basilensis]
MASIGDVSFGTMTLARALRQVTPAADPPMLRVVKHDAGW